MLNESNKKSLKRFAKIVFKHKKQHIFAAFFMLINSLLILVLPILTMQIIDNAIKGKDVSLLIKLILIYLAISILQGGTQVLSDYIYSIIGKKVIFDLKIKVLNHISKLSGKYYTDMKTGDLMTIVNSDIFIIESVATKMIFSLISDILTSIIMFVFLIRLQLDLLIITMILQILMLYTQLRFTKKIASKTEEIRNTLGKISSMIQEYLSGVIHIITLNAKNNFFFKYITTERQYLKQGINLETNMSLSISSAILISSLVSIGIYGYGGYKVIVGNLTIGGLIAFSTYSQRLLGPAIKIAQSNTRIQQALVSINRIFNVLDEPIDIKQVNEAYKINDSLNDGIEFKNVSFSYNENSLILNGVDLNFKAGKVTALVGSSGSGKSTISKLLIRLWDIDSGEIFLEGVNIKEYNLESIRKSISIVSQDVFLFDDTILNNIVLTKRNVRFSDVEEAAKKADIYEFIMSLPDKFNTLVGERGIKLSGGQKQRISIARAIIKNSPVVVFDEATSSLDNISEKNILENLKDFFEDKTVIVIAHRLSTVENADVIYVLKDGKVVEKGSHHELMNTRKVYYNLYTRGISA